MGDRRSSRWESMEGVQSIMKKQEADRKKRAVIQDTSGNRKSVSQQGKRRESNFAASRRRSSLVEPPARISSAGIESRGHSASARAPQSWETEWNVSAAQEKPRSGSVHGRQRSMSFRPSTGPRSWTGMPTVQMENRKSGNDDDTDPDELLRWTTEARQRDRTRQQLLDQRKKLQMDDYDPDVHRDHLVLISDKEALAITFNVFVGATFVGLPMAYVNSGLLVGSIGVFVMAVCVSYCMHILIYWRYEVLKELRQSWSGYPRVMEVSVHHGPRFIAKFGVALKVFIHILFIPYLIYSTAVQCVFMADALQKIMVYYEEHKNIRIYIALLLIVLLPVSIIPNLKIMAIVSCFGIFSSFVVCVLIIVAIVIAKRDHILSGELVDTAFDSPLYLLVTLSTLQPVAQLMCIESHMKHRKHYLGYFGVMNRALIIVTCVYLLLSSVAYAKYSENTEDNILDNLTVGRLEVAACAVFIISVILTYPMNIYTVYDFAWEVYLRQRLHGFPVIEKVLWGYAVRICVALFTVIIAIIIVNIIETKYFVMAICLPLLILIFPPIFELNMGYRTSEYGPRRYKFWINIIVILFGVATLVLTFRAYIIIYLKSQ